MDKVEKLSADIGKCRICVERPIKSPLPHRPRPVAVLSSKAKIALCGQAPGNRVNQSGIPFTDPSGDRLREWLAVSEEQFYDPDKFAIIPMGFCFPGNDENGGDLPPRKECRLRWHDEVFAAMGQIELKILIGKNAQEYHLGKLAEKNLTQTVMKWRDFLNAGDGGVAAFPLPHPSWRNTGWIKKNPWFSNALLPELKKQIQSYLA